MAVIVTDDPALLAWGGQAETYVIPTNVYEFVKEYVEKNKKSFDILMRSESPGTVFYWEKNYHDKIRDFIYDVSGFPHNHISNALSAFGY
jgi:hypothetical protein